MKALKIVGVVILAIILIVVGYGMSLSGEAHLERSVVINAPAAKVFNQVNRFTNLKEWSPWAKIDPETKYEFTGPEYGVGAAYTWDSEHPDVRQGAQKILESRENEYVKTEMDFGIEGEFIAEFILEPVEGGTKLTWTYDGKTNSILWKILLSGSEEQIGGTYDEGVKSLKAYVESIPDPVPELLELEHEPEGEPQ